MEQQADSSKQTPESLSLHSQTDVQDTDLGLDNDPQGDLSGEQVHVLYLDVPASDEPQVLDLTNLLAQQGIQMIESNYNANHLSSNLHIHGPQEIEIINEDAADVSMVTCQINANLARGLSSSQTVGSQHVQVSDVLAAHREAELIIDDREQNTSAEALLQLSTEANAGTYIVDETGTMIPISQMSRSSALLEVEDTGVTTIAICQCWCGREFISQQDLDRHKLAHKYLAQGSVFSGVQKCSLCLECFHSNKELRAHHSEFHPGTMPWECNICRRTFHKKIAMKAHMRVHNTWTRYQCSSCKKVFFYKSALSRHLKMHSCEKPFKCTICGEMYHSLWDLRKHRMNHQPPKMFACDICTKVFKQKQTLFVHSRIHTGQKPYSCEVCQRTFSLKSTLIQHRRIHTGEKPNICEICQRAFRQNSTLKAHLRTHANLKPYMCRYCKMRFAYRDEVTEHEHSHAHNKTWQCDECGMWFKNQSLLARHSRVHTNDRPFQCNICYKSFVQSGSLQSHLRSHTKEKPYQCRICSKAYYTSGTLLVHIRKFHNVDARSVKEVFPVYNYIEDQKVFTIRNSLLSQLKPAGDADHDESSATDRSNLEDLLNKDGTIIEELVETSSEVIVQDSRMLDERVISSEVHFDLAAGNSNSSLPDNKNIVDLGKVDNKEIELENKETRQNEGYNSATEDGEQDETLQSSHAAQDRQEAALGLAELSLTGGDSLHVEKHPQTKTRTFFKEEEEDENDPNVTKIILSKEGGIMNSQDPHQCPVCGRIFGRKSIMIEHIRIHTDEKPYKCDFCQAGFRQNAQLRSHIRNNHTQVERYQCSFCHNRFLSRSITVRHINFHHKLKIKFSQNMDPAWTVDSAVWSDDNFELNVTNPQFLSVGKKKKHGKKGDTDLAPLVVKSHNTVPLAGKSSKGNLQVEAAQPIAEESKYKVSLQPTAIKSVVHEGIKTTSPHVIDSLLDKSASLIPQEFSEPSNIKHEVNEQNSADLPSLQTAITSEDTRTNKPLETASNGVVEANFGGSRMACRICLMQFRGVSSLRCHLRKVHKTTMEQADDDKNTADKEDITKTHVEVMSPELKTKNCKQKEIVSKSENKTVKIVVYDDSKKCVDESPKGNMSHICLICEQRYSSKAALEEHLKNHSEEEVEKVSLHRCDLCASVMKNTQQLTKHILKFHGVAQIYVCSICQREFFQQSSVYRHMKFLHKWEMKIRGEASIPVFIKPASLNVQTPNSSSVAKTSKDSLAEHTKRPITELSSGTDDSFTYINLELSDLDNLQIFKSDGQELLFHVVGSEDKMASLNLGDKINKSLQKAETETAEILETDKSQNSTSKQKVESFDSAVSSQTASTLETVKSLESSTVQRMTVLSNIISTEASLPVTCKKNVTTSADSSSFIVVSSDMTAQSSMSKQVISQLVTALNNSSLENKVDNSCQIIQVRNKPESHSVHQGKSIQTLSIERTQKTSLKPRKPDSTNIQAPIIMSVKNISASYSKGYEKTEHQSILDNTSNPTQNDLSADKDNFYDRSLTDLSCSKLQATQSPDAHVRKFPGTKREVTKQGLQSKIAERAAETSLAANQSLFVNLKTKIDKSLLSTNSKAKEVDIKDKSIKMCTSERIPEDASHKKALQIPSNDCHLLHAVQDSTEIAQEQEYGSKCSNKTYTSLRESSNSSHSVLETKKHLPANKALEGSSEHLRRSSSGRVIKRKNFYDEMEDIKTVSKKKKQ